MIAFGDKIAVWEEDEDPTATVTETVRALGYPSGTIAVDEATPFFTFDGLRRAGNAYTFINSIDVTAGCRMIKSEHELALMQTAKNITLEAHKAAARIMREGITTTEVQAFMTAPHRPRHRPRRARMALSREGRQDRAEARHDLLERADHLHLRRIRRAPRGPHGHHRNRRPLVYPAGPFGRRSLRPGEVRTQMALGLTPPAPRGAAIAAAGRRRG